MLAQMTCCGWNNSQFQKDNWKQLLSSLSSDAGPGRAHPRGRVGKAGVQVEAEVQRVGEKSSPWQCSHTSCVAHRFLFVQKDDGLAHTGHSPRAAGSLQRLCEQLIRHAGGAPGFNLQHEGLHFTDTCLSTPREITWARVSTFMINSGIIPSMGRNNPNKPLCKMLQMVVNA